MSASVVRLRRFLAVLIAFVFVTNATAGYTCSAMLSSQAPVASDVVAADAFSSVRSSADCHDAVEAAPKPVDSTPPAPDQPKQHDCAKSCGMCGVAHLARPSDIVTVSQMTVPALFDIVQASLLGRDLKVDPDIPKTNV